MRRNNKAKKIKNIAQHRTENKVEWKTLLPFAINKIILPLLCSALCAFALYFFATKHPSLRTWFGLIADTTPESYMEAYYNKQNVYNASPNACNDIVILDLRDEITRQDIGDLIYMVSECSPKAVGVDCTFSASHSYDTKQTDSLIYRIAQIPESFPIVFAHLLNEPSIIPDSLIRHKGFVNFIGFNDYHAFEDSIPHFAVEIARIAGYDISIIETESFIVNYRTKDFTSNSFQIDTAFRDTSVQNYIRDITNNKIVIIGGLNDPLDMHHTPYRIEGSQDQISGTKIIAYTLSSIISASNNKQYEHNQMFHHYIRLSKSANMLWTIVLVILYMTIYGFVHYAQTKLRWFILFKPVLLLVTIIIVLLSAMKVTEILFYVPDMVPFMIMTAFIGFWYDLFNQDKSVQITK